MCTVLLSEGSVSVCVCVCERERDAGIVSYLYYYTHLFVLYSSFGENTDVAISLRKKV